MLIFVNMQGTAIPRKKKEMNKIPRSLVREHVLSRY